MHHARTPRLYCILTLILSITRSSVILLGCWDKCVPSHDKGRNAYMAGTCCMLGELVYKSDGRMLCWVFGCDGEFTNRMFEKANTYQAMLYIGGFGEM